MSKDSVIILLIAIAFIWWCWAIGFQQETKMLEGRIWLMYEQVKELRQIDKQKCIDLFID
jgi:hypothetical protein